MSQVSQVTVSSPDNVLVQAFSNKHGTGESLPILLNSAYEKPRTSVDSPKADSLLRVRDIAAPHSGHIRILELNKPSTRNAISLGLLAELSREIDVIRMQFDAYTGEEVSLKRPEDGFTEQNGSTRALIIASAVDSCFCSGADLKERKGFTPDQTNEFLTSLRGTLTALSQLPIPTISAVGSLALGGGLELALATHFRVVSSNAIMALPETSLGIIPGAGGTYRLSALIGVSQARKLVLTGRRITGTEAYRLGIADHLVDVNLHLQGTDSVTGMEKGKTDRDVLAEAGQKVLAEAMKLAQEICQGGPIAVRAAIQLFRDGPSVDTEGAMYDRVMKTEDRNEALKAFGEKRRPVFTGR